MLKSFLIVCPLTFLAGFVDSIAGGGGLISLPAFMFAGLPVHTAIGTNKLSSSMGTTVATAHYIREGYMDWSICIPCLVFSVAGSFLGARLGLYLSEFILKIVILCVLPFMAFYVFRKDSLLTEREGGFSKPKTIFLCGIVAFAVGIYDGLYGPGTGTILILLLTALCRLTLEKSAGTTKIINLTTNYTALVVFLTEGNVLLPLGLAAGAFNMAGNYLGSHSFSKNGSKITRPIILVVLAIFFVKVVWELCTGI